MKDKHENQNNGEKKNTGSQTIQFLGGLYAATRYVFTGGQSPVPPPVDNKYTPDNRQEFRDSLEKIGKKKRVIASEHAQYEKNMMDGQNNAQTKLKQPMPKETIELFVKQVDEHAKLDKEARKTGKPKAPDKEHHNINIKHHQQLSEAFGDAGYPSGQLLHQFGLIQNMVKRDLVDTDLNNLNSAPNRKIFGSD